MSTGLHGREMVALPPGCRRVHLIGGAGTGKTTLLRALSAALAVPAFELDLVAYERGAGDKRTLPARLADVERILTSPGWVTEGIYLWWIDALLAEADVTIWLDLPWPVAACRIVRRHLLAELAGANRHAGWGKLLRFLRRTHEWYHEFPPRPPLDPTDDGATSRAATARHLKPFAARTIRAGANTRFTYRGRLV